MLYPDFNDLIGFKNRKSNLIHSSRTVRSITPGNHHSPFRGQGLEFDSVREYVTGDDIRNIDWRVTARTGSPHIKLFKEERERTVILCVDVNAAMRFGTKNTFKSIQAARIASFLGWQALARHHCVSACLFGDVPGGIQLFPPKRTRQSFCTMLKMLTEPFAGTHCTSWSYALEHIYKAAHTGSLVYVISDFMDPDKQLSQETVLSRLKKRCDVVFIATNDKADQIIPPVGIIGFCTNPSEKVYVDTESLSGRNAYNALWENNRSSLYEMTSKFKIPLLELTTESDVRRDLVLGLKAMATQSVRRMKGG